MSTSDYAAPPSGRIDQWSVPRVPALSTEGWIVLALVVVAAVIRGLVIDTQSFWRDEALTAYEARLPFGAMVHVVTHIETTPPLYFGLIWIWGHLFGTTEIALRLPSAIAGVALVPVSYLCARELVSRRAGVLAAAFVAVNPFLIWYSQEARAYMLLTLLCGASLLWFIRARADADPRNLALWAVFSALAVTTHFFAGFLVFAEALWLLWIHRTRLVALAVAAVGFVQVAMLPFAVIDAGHGTSWIAHVPRLNRVSAAVAEWGVSILYERLRVHEGLYLGLIFVGLLALLILRGGDQPTRAAAKVAAALVAVVWLVPLVLAYLGEDYFLARNVMPAVVPVAVLIAIACTAPRARLWGGALAVALLALFSYATVDVQSHAWLERPDWRAVAHSLGPAEVPRAILASGGLAAQPLKSYMPGVDWTQPGTRRMVIQEIDVVGARKRFALRGVRVERPGPLLEAGALITPHGWPLPARAAPRGARLLARFRLQNWIVARFALRRPLDVTIDQLRALAPQYFLRTPDSLLVFMQPPDQ